MAVSVDFYGKNYVEPGAYATTVYNPTSVVNVSQFGNVMIIDTGIGAVENGYQFGGGSGVIGELAKGIKSVYEFTSYEDFRAFVGGGMIASVAEKLFTPYDGATGTPRLYYARAATTKSALITLTISEGNALVLKCKNEGANANGIVDDTVLKFGYGARIVAGDDGGFKLQVFRGNYQGTDDAGEPYGAYNLANAVAQLLGETKECATLGELFEVVRSNKTMNAHFIPSTTGDLTTSLAASAALVPATGGTTAYLSGDEMATLLDSITELNVTFFLCANTEVNKGVDAATNGKLFTFLKNEAKFTEFMVVPSGADDTQLFGEQNTAEAIAKYYNDPQVIAVFGAPQVTRRDNNGTKDLNPIYLAATITGLLAGGRPWTPLTFGRVGYTNFVYDLKKKEREKALQLGILHVRNVNGYWVVNQSINTVQDNLQPLNMDGNSFEISIELIKAQLSKELIVDAQNRFTGKTIAQTYPEAIKNFTETKLASLVAEVGNDNMIISWKNVVVKAKNNDYYVSFDFIPNGPVNKQFFVGNVLDFTLE